MAKDEDAGRVATARAAAELKRELDENHVAMGELHRALARLKMLRYRAFVSAGFTEAHALFLIRD